MGCTLHCAAPCHCASSMSNYQRPGSSGCQQYCWILVINSLGFVFVLFVIYWLNLILSFVQRWSCAIDGMLKSKN